MTRIRLGAALLVVALGAVGCGSATAGGATSPPTSAPSTTSRPSSSAGSSTTSLNDDPTDPPLPASSRTTGPPVTLTGIPERGVEPSCLVLHGYVLNGGDRTLLASGVSVTVTGHTDPTLMSYCQQGTILVVDAVTGAS